MSSQPLRLDQSIACSHRMLQAALHGDGAGLMLCPDERQQLRQPLR